MFSYDLVFGTAVAIFIIVGLISTFKDSLRR